MTNRVFCRTCQHWRATGNGVTRKDWCWNLVWSPRHKDLFASIRIPRRAWPPHVCDNRDPYSPIISSCVKPKSFLRYNFRKLDVSLSFLKFLFIFFFFLCVVATIDRSHWCSGDRQSEEKIGTTSAARGTYDTGFNAEIACQERRANKHCLSTAFSRQSTFASTQHADRCLEAIFSFHKKFHRIQKKKKQKKYIFAHLAIVPEVSKRKIAQNQKNKWTNQRGSKSFVAILLAILPGVSKRKFHKIL